MSWPQSQAVTFSVLCCQVYFLVSESCYFGVPNHGTDLPGSSADFFGIVFWNQQKTFLYFSHVKLGGAVISCYTRGWSGEKSSCKYVKQKHDLSCHFACPCCQGLRGISLGGREQLASSSLSPASQTHHCSRCNSKANCHLPPCFFS